MEQDIKKIRCKKCRERAEIEEQLRIKRENRKKRTIKKDKKPIVNIQFGDGVLYFD